jgi:hypothetical protein
VLPTSLWMSGFPTSLWMSGFPTSLWMSGFLDVWIPLDDY